jgi:hypothetical protein
MSSPLFYVCLQATEDKMAGRPLQTLEADIRVVALPAASGDGEMRVDLQRAGYYHGHPGVAGSRGSRVRQLA